MAKDGIGMNSVEWTPAMEAWVVEALSRSKPLTVAQLELLTALARKTLPRQ